MPHHRNKTFATFLALAGGNIGLHRFYIAGWRDTWGWLHAATLPLSIMLWAGAEGGVALFSLAPLVLSTLAGYLEGLVIGLTPDEKWDRQRNPLSGRASDSSWLLALVLVLTVALGATALIAAISRSVDLFLTGGAYG
jgi:hypothetical protein